MSTPARTRDATTDVVTPAPADADELAQVLSFIEAHEALRSTLPTRNLYKYSVDEQ